MLKKKQKNNGKNFENQICIFLKLLIDEIFINGSTTSYWDIEPIVNGSGTQYGRDITAQWKYNGTSFRWWIECKDYSKNIPKSCYADKILEALVKHEKPTCFCLITKLTPPTNWFRHIQSDLRTQEFPKFNLFHWPILAKNGTKTILKCYPRIHDAIYPSEPIELINKQERKRILGDAKYYILEMNNEGLKFLKEQKVVNISQSKKENEKHFL